VKAAWPARTARSIGSRWIVDGPRETPEIVFFDTNEAEPHAVYIAHFKDNKLVSSRVLGTGDDTTSFAPGEAGQASFLLEGLKEGLHTISFDLEAMLEGLPSGPVKVRGEVTGAVLVRDASFAVTFTHPNVVRAGNDYDLGMTVYNSGQTDIQGAFAQLPPNSISGAALLGQDSGQRQFATTIKRGVRSHNSARKLRETTVHTIVMRRTLARSDAAKMSGNPWVECRLVRSGVTALT